MDIRIERIKGAFSNNPVYDELMYKLAELSAKWRGTKEETLVQRYRIVLMTLLEVGWHGNLGVDIELPNELMPEGYLRRYQQMAEPPSESATNKRTRGALSNNPVYDELMHKLAELSAKWRGSKDPALVTRYQHVLLTLIELGWNGLGHDALDVELELPNALMPPEYFRLYDLERDEPSQIS